MSSSNRLRWRDRRDTVPARRHRRRQRRRDIERGGDYEPMDCDPHAASRGVQSRLAGAIAALAVTLGCVLTGFVFPLSTFATTFAFTLGFTSFGAAVAFLMSARHEEEVHEIGDQLDTPEGLPEPDEEDGTDGSVAKLDPEF